VWTNVQAFKSASDFDSIPGASVSSSVTIGRKGQAIPRNGAPSNSITHPQVASKVGGELSTTLCEPLSAIPRYLLRFMRSRATLSH